MFITIALQRGEGLIILLIWCYVSYGLDLTYFLFLKMYELLYFHNL